MKTYTLRNFRVVKFRYVGMINKYRLEMLSPSGQWFEVETYTDPQKARTECRARQSVIDNAEATGRGGKRV